MGGLYQEVKHCSNNGGEECVKSNRSGTLAKECNGTPVKECSGTLTRR